VTSPQVKHVDCGSNDREDVGTFLVDQLLHFFPDSYAMLSAYLDESGTGGESPVLCVAGILYSKNATQRLDQAWKRALKSEGISYFHAVECEHRKGEFEGWNSAETEDFRNGLVRLIGKHASGHAVAYCVQGKGFKELNPFDQKRWDFKPYTACANACMSQLIKTADKLGHKTVTFAIESGPGMGGLDELIRKRQDMDGWKRMASCQFHDKKSRLVQTADLFAYEYAKRIREWDTKPIREVFKAIVPGGEIVPLIEPVLKQIARLYPKR
jgi:hypothetical protein